MSNKNAEFYNRHSGEYYDDDDFFEPNFSDEDTAHDPSRLTSQYHIHKAETALQNLKLVVRDSKWKKILYHKSGVSIYSKSGDTDDKLPIFMGEHIIEGFAPQAIFAVIGMRKLWDDWYEEGSLIENLDDTTSLTYMVMQALAGSKIRDLSLVEKIECDPDGTICFVSTSVETPKVPPNPNRIRAHIVLNGWILEPLSYDPPRTKAIYILQTKIRGWVPSILSKTYLARRPLVLHTIDQYLQKNGPPPMVISSTPPDSLRSSSTYQANKYRSVDLKLPRKKISFARLNGTNSSNSSPQSPIQPSGNNVSFHHDDSYAPRSPQSPRMRHPIHNGDIFSNHDDSRKSSLRSPPIHNGDNIFSNYDDSRKSSSRSPPIHNRDNIFSNHDDSRKSSSRSPPVHNGNSHHDDLYMPKSSSQSPIPTGNNILSRNDDPYMPKIYSQSPVQTNILSHHDDPYTTPKSSSSSVLSIPPPPVQPPVQSSLEQSPFEQSSLEQSLPEQSSSMQSPSIQSPSIQSFVQSSTMRSLPSTEKVLSWLKSTAKPTQHRHTASVQKAIEKFKFHLPMDGWDLYSENNNLRIYVKEIAGKSTPIMRGDGVISGGFTIYEILSVIKNLEMRKLWDDRFEEGTAYEMFSSNERLARTVMKGTFPISGRDMSICDMLDYDDDSGSFITTSVVDKLIPESKKTCSGIFGLCRMVIKTKL